MKFRIKKNENGFYFAEYRCMFLWFYLHGSLSRNIEKTKKACMQFEGKDVIVENFKL